MSTLFAAFFISHCNPALLSFAMLSLQLLKYILQYETFYQADHNAKVHIPQVQSKVNVADSPLSNAPMS
jgi:hypothetical protein